jgi:hypothetical protein
MKKILGLLKKILGIFMVLFGVLLALATLKGCATGLPLKIDTPEEAGAFAGYLTFHFLMSVIVFLLIKYGVKYSSTPKK